MPSLFIIIFVLMMLALIIGFLIGWILRRTATRKKYVQHISDLTKEDHHLASKLHSDAASFTTNENNHIYIQEKLEATNEEISLYSKRHIAVVKEIKELHTNQQDVATKLQHIDKDLELSKKDLELLQTQKEELLSLKTSHFDSEQNVHKKTKEIEELNQHIKSLITNRETLTQKSQNIDNIITKLEADIAEKSNQIQGVEAKFDLKKVEVLKELEKNKQKALNYQYAIKHVNEKLNSGEKIATDTIDKIISKNEETKIFENIIQKLFRKSAKYIQGVK